MIKYILLIALLLPFPVLSHEWDQDKWLETLLWNHVMVVDCWSAVNDENIMTFRDRCSLYTMGTTENKAMAQYREARAHHPDLDRLAFFSLHFPEHTNEEVWQISLNMTIINQVNAIIVGMYIVEGLTRNDK